MSAARRTASGTVAALMACGAPGPAVVHYGEALCDHCHMTINDPAYGGQLVTRTGRVYRFDDPGCLAAFVQSGAVPEAEVFGLWFNDYQGRGVLIPEDSAVFASHVRFHPPMGSGIAVLRAGPAADSLVAALAAERLTWTEVLARSASTPAPGAAP